MKNNGSSNSAFSFSFVIVQKSDSNTFYGTVKEVDGVIVKGTSEQEVVEKIHKAIKAIMRAKKKYSNASKIASKDDTMVVKEIEQNYQPC